MIEIDASAGEGGGQVVRSAVALAACTGTAVRLYRIRERRERPGLRAQHLAAVRAAAMVCGARVAGADIASPELSFEPGPPQPGEFEIDVGTAGSTMLVLQTVLPALSFCAAPSRLLLRGGTHNPRAPTFEFVRDAYLPAIRRLGFRGEVELEAYGFFPRGGGLVRATVEPRVAAAALDLRVRGRIVAMSATAVSSRLPGHVARREIATLRERLGLSEGQSGICAVAAASPGNVLQLRVDAEHVTTVFSAFGERGKPAEAVAASLADDVEQYLAAGVAVDSRLTDQLLLPLALASGGCFSTLPPTLHTGTNAAVIGRVLPIGFAADAAGEGSCLVSVTPLAPAGKDTR